MCTPMTGVRQKRQQQQKPNAPSENNALSFGDHALHALAHRGGCRLDGTWHLIMLQFYQVNPPSPAPVMM